MGRIRVTRGWSAAVLLGLSLCVAAIAYAQESKSQKTFTGPSVKLGDGKVWAFVETDTAGRVKSVGVTMTEAALQGLPAEVKDTCCGGEETVLYLPAKAPATPFTHVVLNWNPHGHPPAGIYDKPHFDFHFYLISEKVRAGIQATDQKTMLPPPAQNIPKGWIAWPEATSRMGVHWADMKSPEFHGQPFTYTFIYGAYDGKVSFFEPMITRAFLLSHPDVVAPIEQPEVPADQRFQPKQYRVRYDASRHEITVAMDRVGEQ